MPRARSDVNVRRPTWSDTTDGEMPRSASDAMVLMKFLPSPTTQDVRTM